MSFGFVFDICCFIMPRRRTWRRQRVYSRWFGMGVNPKKEQIMKLLHFHRPLGPVPNMYDVGYMIIGGREFISPDLPDWTMNFYLEFVQIRVTQRELELWFPGFTFEPRSLSVEDAARLCGGSGRFAAQGVHSSFETLPPVPE